MTERDRRAAKKFRNDHRWRCSVCNKTSSEPGIRQHVRWSKGPCAQAEMIALEVPIPGEAAPPPTDRNAKNRAKVRAEREAKGPVGPTRKRVENALPRRPAKPGAPAADTPKPKRAIDYLL